MSVAKNSKFDHCVIVGASIAGLLAAGAASRSFKRVTVIERDQLEDVAEARKGVPQGGQIHALLPVGLERMQMVFPDLKDRLIKAGARTFDEMADIAVLTSVGWMVRNEGVEWVACRRPVLELNVRQCLQELPNVEIIHKSVGGVVVEGVGAARAVTGVRLRDGSVIDADLVINSTGRRGKGPDWLAEYDVQPPRESFLNAWISYTTQFVRFPEGTFKHGVIGLGALPQPGINTRGCAFFPADNGLHAMTAIGYMRDCPDRDPAAVIEWLKESACPLSAEIAAKAEPIGEVLTYMVEGSLLRHWHEVKNLPDRFLTVGDSACSMNPVFGQGMSLSASAAMLLLEELETATTLDGLASSVQNKLAPVLQSAFNVVASNDAGFEGAQWSDDYTPMSQEEADHGLALGVLATQDAKISNALSMAIYSFRPEDLGAPEITEACEAWLSGDRVIPPFDRNVYPSTVASTKKSAEVA